LETLRWHFEHVIRLGSQATGQAIEQPIERNFGFGTAGFTGKNLPLRLKDGGSVDEDNSELFGWRIEEVGHGKENNTAQSALLYDDSSHS
jgi:hypothetical protein